jgi:hypothetical protein
MPAAIPQPIREALALGQHGSLIEVVLDLAHER